MDESHFEMAERLEQAQRDIAVRRATAASAAETHPDFDGAHCVRCEDPIQPARLKLGKVRCVDCQTRQERRHG